MLFTSVNNLGTSLPLHQVRIFCVTLLIIQVFLGIGSHHQQIYASDYNDKNFCFQTDSCLLSLALKAYHKKDYKQAKKYFLKHTHLFPNNVVVLKYVAKILEKEKNYKKAIQYYKKALNVDTNNINILMSLSLLYLQNNLYKETKTHLKQIIFLDPTNATALYYLATILYHQKKYKEGAIIYKKLLLVAKKMDNKNLIYEAAIKIGSYYQNINQYEKAILYFKEILHLKDVEYRYLYILGLLYKSIGDIEKSIPILEQAYIKSKYNLSILNVLIDSYYIQASTKTRGAIEIFLQKYKNKKPNNIILKQRKALLYEITGKLDQAEEIFNELLEKNPRDIVLRIGLANIYKKTNNKKLLLEELPSITLLAQENKMYQVALKYSQDLLDLLNEKSKELDFITIFLKHKDINYKPLFKDRILSLAYAYIDALTSHATILFNLQSSNKVSMLYYKRANEFIKIMLQNRESVLLSTNNEKNQTEKKLEERKKEILDKLHYIADKNLISISILLREDEKYLQAIKHLNKAIESQALIKNQKNNHILYYHLGVTHYLLGKKKDKTQHKKTILHNALINLKKGLKISKENNGNKNLLGIYHFYIALVWEELNNFDLLEAHLQKALSYEPDNSNYLNYLGYMYSLRKIKLDLASKLLYKALDIEPENISYLDSIGWILYHKGDLDKSLKYLKLAEVKIKEKDTDSVIYFHLAEVYFKLKNYISSKIYYERTLQFIKTASEPLDTQYIQEKIKYIETHKKNQEK